MRKHIATYLVSLVALIGLVLLGISVQNRPAQAQVGVPACICDMVSLHPNPSIAEAFDITYNVLLGPSAATDNKAVTIQITVTYESGDTVLTMRRKTRDALLTAPVIVEFGIVVDRAKIIVVGFDRVPIL